MVLGKLSLASVIGSQVASSETKPPVVAFNYLELLQQRWCTLRVIQALSSKGHCLRDIFSPDTHCSNVQNEGDTKGSQPALPLTPSTDQSLAYEDLRNP